MKVVSKDVYRFDDTEDMKLSPFNVSLASSLQKSKQGLKKTNTAVTAAVKTTQQNEKKDVCTLQSRSNLMDKEKMKQTSTPLSMEPSLIVTKSDQYRHSKEMRRSPRLAPTILGIDVTPILPIVSPKVPCKYRRNKEFDPNQDSYIAPLALTHSKPRVPAAAIPHLSNKNNHQGVSCKQSLQRPNKKSCLQLAEKPDALLMTKITATVSTTICPRINIYQGKRHQQPLQNSLRQTECQITADNLTPVVTSNLSEKEIVGKKCQRPLQNSLSQANHHFTTNDSTPTVTLSENETHPKEKRQQLLENSYKKSAQQTRAKKFTQDITPHLSKMESHQRKKRQQTLQNLYRTSDKKATVINYLTGKENHKEKRCRQKLKSDKNLIVKEKSGIKRKRAQSNHLQSNVINTAFDKNCPPVQRKKIVPLTLSSTKCVADITFKKIAKASFSLLQSKLDCTTSSTKDINNKLTMTKKRKSRHPQRLKQSVLLVDEELQGPWETNGENMFSTPVSCDSGISLGSGCSPSSENQSMPAFMEDEPMISAGTSSSSLSADITEPCM